MNQCLGQLVRNQVIPHLEYYFHEVYEKRADLKIDGVLAFSEKDLFVAGKVINGLSYVTVHHVDTNDEPEKYMTMLREIIAFTSNMKMDSWAYLNYLIGIYRLYEHGLWDKVIGEEMEEVLKEKLDWRTFVNEEDLSLTKKPTNYYGVAFGISRYRNLLGWEESGFEEELPIPHFKEKLSAIPPYHFYQFAKGEYDRGMAVIRDQGHVFMLPLINGGTGTSGDIGGDDYYYQTTYLPIPQENKVLECSPNTNIPLCIPRISLTDGTQLMPITYIKGITTQREENKYIITYRQDKLCGVGGAHTVSDERIASTTTYTFTEGKIEREDVFTLVEEVEIEEIKMEFAVFSTQPIKNDHTVCFETGVVREIQVEGLSEIEIEAILSDNVNYQTSHGALQYRVKCKQAINGKQKEYKMRWCISYDGL